MQKKCPSCQEEAFANGLCVCCGYEQEEPVAPDLSFTDQSIMPDVLANFDKLIELKAQQKMYEDDVDATKKERMALEETTWLMMEKMGGIDSLKKGGHTFFRRTDQYMSVPKATKYETYDWLKENGYEGLFYETINAKTLTSEVKKNVEEDGEEGGEIPECLNVRVVNRIGIKKA